MNPHSNYAYAGHSIRVVCKERRILDWLDEFMLPAFEIGSKSGTSCDVEIHGHFDPDEYKSLLARGSAGDAENFECFSLDGHFGCHPRWRAEGEGTLCCDQRRKIAYGFNPSAGKASLIAASETGRSRIGLMRLLREVATVQCLRKGLIHIHGSAFAQGGSAVVIVGPRKAGKTSLLVNTLRTGKADFVTNDRLFIDRDEGRGGPCDAIGMPTIVNVRAECLEMFPELKLRFAVTSFARELTRQECLHGSEAAIEYSHRWPPSLSPRQFCDLVGVDAVARVPIKSFVFPSISSEIDGFELERMDAESAAAEIYAGVFRSATPQAIPKAFRKEGEDALPTEESIQRACRRLANELACYRCHLGPNAYCESSLAEDFISQALSS